MPSPAADRDRILIVGAGPVGLTAAATLVRRGLSVVVLEEAADIDHEPKASTFHAPTLELLDWLEVTEELLEMGLIADRYQNRDRERGVVAEFDFGVLKNETRYPFRLQCEQQKLCDVLIRQLRASPLAELRFSTELTDFEDTGDAVRVTATGSDGASVALEGRYLLGADGASSTVRERLGIDFPGTTYEDRYLVLLTDFPFEEHLEDLVWVNYVSDPHEYVVLLRAPEAWRVLFPAPPDLTDAVALDPTRAQERLHSVVAHPGDYDILHTQLYRIHQRVADRFRAGRVLLLGDAAHINSPIGGMGMNNGIHDAFDLARFLPQVVAGDSTEDVLDDWARRRRDVALEYVRVITDRNARALGEKDEEQRRAQQAELAATAEDEARAREWLMTASMLKPVREQGLLPYA